MKRKYCHDANRCRHEGECEGECQEWDRSREDQWRNVGGYVCAKHGLVYGTCACCRNDIKREDERNYRQRQVDRIAELEAENEKLGQGFNAGVAQAVGWMTAEFEFLHDVNCPELLEKVLADLGVPK